ncbi:hypothetical protein FGO68_gene9869 [Halteria grandinella]|uniref:Uncharacterized protein n=1 Tax=Halteria grandinella TaxID=5974 RepID=A0A8J8P8A4_HALGN|nr:hypothetical protein FGO68_gene9869 [Halteria grandinella]
MKISHYDLFATLPSEFCQIMDNIKSTSPESNPDYRFIEGLFKQIGSQNKFKIDNKFDWIISKDQKQDPNSQLGKAVAGAMSSTLGQQAVLAGLNKGVDNKHRQSVLIAPSQSEKPSDRRQSMQNAGIGMHKFNEAFMTTLALGQKQEEGVLGQSLQQQITNPIGGANTLTMTINMNFKKEDGGEVKEGERKMAAEKIGKLDNYFKYAQKSADCVMSLNRQEKEKNAHETVVLQVIEENENSIQGDQNTSQQKNSDRQHEAEKMNVTSIMYQNLAMDKNQSNSVNQNPASAERLNNVAQTSATHDLSQNTKLAGNPPGTKSLFMDAKIVEQSQHQTTLEARLPAAISTGVQPVSSSGSKNPASSQGNTIKRQKLVIFGGKKKVSKQRLDVPGGGSRPREGSEEPQMSFIGGMQSKQTKSNIDISINPQHLRDHSEEQQVGQDVPVSADNVVPIREKKEKKKRAHKDVTPTFQQDDVFTKNMSHTAHAVVGRKSSQIFQGQQQMSNTGQIPDHSKKDMISLDKNEVAIPNSESLKVQLQNVPPPVPQASAQQVQHHQSQDGQLDIKVTVNFMQPNNQLNGVGLEAIGGGTLGNGNEKGSDGYEARNGGSANLSNPGNIVQIVLVTRNNANQGTNGYDRQNSQMRNVQVHITSSNQQQLNNGGAAVPVAGAQPDNNMVGSVYNLTLNNHASKVVEEMASSSKLNNQAMVPIQALPSGIGAQKFADLGVEANQRQAQSHQKLAQRFPPLPEEAKEEKDTPKIGGVGQVNQDETNTFDEFQKGILSERKSRLITGAPIQDQSGSPANVSRQIADAFGQNNKTDDINQVSFNNKQIDLSRQFPNQHLSGGFSSPRQFQTHSNEDRMKGKIILPPKTSAPVLNHIFSVKITSQEQIINTHK